MSDPTNSNQFQPTNGELPPAREAIIDQAQRVHQEVAHERDMLRREVAELRTDLAASRVVAEALQAQVTQAESRLETARLERQQAIDDLAPYRVLFQGAVALMRAFEIEHAPLVRHQGEFQSEEQARLAEQARRMGGMGNDSYGHMMGGM